MAHPLGMGQHGNPAPGADVLHELLPAPGDDQVHALLQPEQRLHLGPVVEHLHRIRGEPGLLQSAPHDVRQSPVRCGGLATTLEQDRVPRAKRQGGDLHQRVRS